MRYFSEDTIMDILDKIERENGHSVALSFPNFSELKSINIPDKYGRLGDLDAMKNDYHNTTLEMIEDDSSNKAFYDSLEKIVIGLIDRTPTVIEAN